MFDLKSSKERRVVAIAFDASDHVRHDMAHELLRLFANIVGIKKDFAYIGSEVVADGPNDQA